MDMSWSKMNTDFKISLQIMKIKFTNKEQYIIKNINYQRFHCKNYDL